MAKGGVEGGFAVAASGLGGDGDDGEEDADEAVLEDAVPDNLGRVSAQIRHDVARRAYVEPCQSAAWLSKGPPVLSSGAVLQPVYRQDPVLDLNVPKVLLLFVQRGRSVVAHESEKAGNGKGLVAVAHDLPVDCVAIVVVGQERDEGVDGNHEEDADNVLLFPGPRVVERVSEDEVHGDDNGNTARDGGYEESDVVEGDLAIVRHLAID